MIFTYYLVYLLTLFNCYKNMMKMVCWFIQLFMIEREMFHICASINLAVRMAQSLIWAQ